MVVQHKPGGFRKGFVSIASELLQGGADHPVSYTASQETPPDSHPGQGHGHSQAFKLVASAFMAGTLR